MADSTGVDRPAIDKASADLKALVTDGTIAEFEKLNSFDLNAGPPGMDAAQWLEDVLIDRRHGMIEHVKNLKFVFTGLADTLITVANAIQNTDTAAASALDGAATTAINDWITSVKSSVVPPALGSGHFMTGKTTYESGDTANPQGAFLSFETDSTGYHKVDGNGDLIMTLPQPSDEGHLPNQVMFDEYGNIITDLNNKPGIGSTKVDENFIFADGTQKIRPDDPEN